MGHLEGFKQLIESGPCASYEALKQQWIFGNTDLVRAVLSPFTSNAFDSSSLSSVGSSERSRNYF